MDNICRQFTDGKMLYMMFDVDYTVERFLLIPNWQLINGICINMPVIRSTNKNEIFDN